MDRNGPASQKADWVLFLALPLTLRSKFGQIVYLSVSACVKQTELHLPCIIKCYIKAVLWNTIVNMIQITLIYLNFLGHYGIRFLHNFLLKMVSKNCMFSLLLLHNSL